MSEQVALPNTALPPPSSAEFPALPVTTEDTGRVIGRLQQHLQLLLVEQTALLKRIRLIRHTVAGLTDIFGPDILNEELKRLLRKPGRHIRERSHLGLTETCRRILMEVSQPLTVRQLCDRIRQDNPDLFARHKDLTASVAVMLKRLVSYGEVRDGLNERDGRTWLWSIKAKEGTHPLDLTSEVCDPGQHGSGLGTDGIADAGEARVRSTGEL